MHGSAAFLQLGWRAQGSGRPSAAPPARCMLRRAARLFKRPEVQQKAAAALLLTATAFGAAAVLPQRREIMSWFTHTDSNAALVDSLAQYGIVRSKEVEEAMRAVDRGHYCDDPSVAYVDTPQPIGYGATISAPHMHAYALELLKEWLRPGAKVLDVGSGSGYLTAIMARMVTAGGAQGAATGIEHIPQLVETSRKSVRSDPACAGLLESGRLQLVVGDGRKGFPEGAPYAAIHVGAAAPRLPSELVAQLAPGGRMVVPVGAQGGMQSLVVVDKSEDETVTRRDAMSVMFVPLTAKETQLHLTHDEP